MAFLKCLKNAIPKEVFLRKDGNLFPTMYHQFLRPDQAWVEVGEGNT